MRHLPRLLALILSMLALAMPAAAKHEPFDFGPPPDWEEYKQQGEAALRAALPDQANWAVEWPNGYIPYEWHHKGWARGYLTCGIMRATAPVTGRYPLTNFIVVIDRGVVQKVDIAPRAMNDIRNQVCVDWVAKGMLPPARMMQTSAAMASARPAAPSDDISVATIGLTLRPMPEGAYVVAAQPGSAARRAGLVAGTVITSVNGIPLAGMGTAMGKLLASDVPSLAVETAAGDKLTLTRTAP